MMDKKDLIIIYSMTVKPNEMNNYGLGVLGGITEGSMTIESGGRNEVSFTTRLSFYNADKLKPLNVIRVKGQLYRIYNVSTNPITDEIKVEARHILYDLNEPIDKFNYTSTMRDIIEKLLGGYYGTVFEVVFDDPDNFYEGLIVTYDSEGFDSELTITSAIINLIAPYGLILVRDNTTLVVKNINGVSSASKLLINWENLECFNNTQDSSSFYTRVWATGKEGLELPEKFIYVEGIKERPPQEITKKMQYDTESVDELRFLATECAAKMNYLFDNITLKLSDIQKSNRFKHLEGLFDINVGDVVSIMAGKYREKKRIINKKVNLVTGETSIELGDTAADFIDSMVDEQKEIEQRTKDLLRTNYFSYSNYSEIKLDGVPKSIADITFGNNLGGMNSKLFFNAVVFNRGNTNTDVHMSITYKNKLLAFSPKQTVIPGYNIVNFTYPIFDVHETERVIITATASGEAYIEAEQLNVLIDLFGGSSKIEKKSPNQTVYHSIGGNAKELTAVQEVDVHTQVIYKNYITPVMDIGAGTPNTIINAEQDINIEINRQ